MELIGRINRQKVYYIPRRNNPNWTKGLPKNNWLIITIANQEDEEIIPSIAKKCIDNKVNEVCCIGTATMAKYYF